MGPHGPRRQSDGVDARHRRCLPRAVHQLRESERARPRGRHDRSRWQLPRRPTRPPHVPSRFPPRTGGGFQPWLPLRASAVNKVIRMLPLPWGAPYPITASTGTHIPTGFDNSSSASRLRRRKDVTQGTDTARLVPGTYDVHYTFDGAPPPARAVMITTESASSTCISTSTCFLVPTSPNTAAPGPGLGGNEVASQVPHDQETTHREADQRAIQAQAGSCGRRSRTAFARPWNA